MRNYAFIDSQNLNLSILDQGWQLDFARFRVYLKDKYHVSRAFLFLGYIQNNQSLYKYLKRAGYILVFKPIIDSKKNNLVKGNVDAELVLHAMIRYQHYDKAMIISGDGDFYCLIKYLKKMKKLHSVMIPNPNKFSALLRRFRSHLIFIHQLKNKLGIKKKRE